MIGFKAFNKDLTCRGFQYEIGGEYKYEGMPIPCKQGFHFCRTIADCYRYYDKDDRTRICKVEAIGIVETDDNIKFCTNVIKILDEITVEFERKGNNNSLSSGYCNSGDCNSGDCNSGDCNSGNRNSGDCNSGDCNSGNRNSGNRNSGNRNSGDCNSGDWNSGDCNSGNWNSGNRNSGNRNSGNWNSGDWNSGNRNSGCFNTGTPNLKFFDKDSEWNIDIWYYSKQRKILSDVPNTVCEWVDASYMSDEEKNNNPSYVTTGGYLRIIEQSDSVKKWWDELPNSEKDCIRELPNYDEEKFLKCIGIK